MLLENFGHKNKFGKEIININAKSKYKVDWEKKKWMREESMPYVSLKYIPWSV